MTGGVVELPVDTAWAVGFVLAMSRVAAFALTSPFLGSTIPVAARLAFASAVGLAATQPVPGVVELGDLLVAGMVNVTVGAVLGYVTGVVVYLFSTAGGIVDWVSGLAVSAVFDPLQGDQSGIFARMFHLVAVTMFVAAGGLGLLVTGLVGSTWIVPLDAAVTLQPGLTGYVVDLVAGVVRSGLELALPVIGVLIMVELALGLASRFAPQANVFLLGLPAKLLTSLTVVASSWVLFPDAMAGVESTVARGFEVGLRGLGG